MPRDGSSSLQRGAFATAAGSASVQELKMLAYARAKAASASAYSTAAAAVAATERTPAARELNNEDPRGAALPDGVSETDLAEAEAQDVESRIHAAASSHDALLDEANTKSGVLQYTFTWRHNAEKGSDVSKAPLPVTFQKEVTKKIFGPATERGVYLMSAYIESAHNNSPFPINFTLRNVDGADLERVWNDDGEASTLSLSPGQTWEKEIQVHRMKPIDSTSLYNFGNVNINDEMAACTRIKNTSKYIVPADRLVGKLFKSNYDELAATSDAPPPEPIAAGNAYYADESDVVNLLAAFEDQVLKGFKPTNFNEITGEITRADRPSSSTSASFGDAESAPGITTRAQREAAHAATHQVTVNVRYHIVDPARMKDLELE